VNQRDALRQLAGDVLVKLEEMRVYDEKYGHQLAARGTKDHDRWMLAYEELQYRLMRIEDPSLRRKSKVSAPDPNQVALFE
jgi:hypothetical protein